MNDPLFNSKQMQSPEIKANITPMEGKTCLVTGATSGIGKVTATSLAAQGADVIITGRNEQKAKDVVHQIIAETGNHSVRYLLADFSDLQQVRLLADSVRDRCSRLDVLVNNAGAFFPNRRDTPFGVEMTFLVNHLAPFLLTNMLLDSLQTSPSARIVNVSSNAHKQFKGNFNDLRFEHGYSGMKAYARSKLANIFFTYELARRSNGTEVLVNALHPGHIATDIWKTNFPRIGSFLKWIMGLFAISLEQGADNSIYLASSLQVAGITGKYFLKRAPVQSSATSYDTEMAQKLWEISEGLTGLK